MHLYLQISHDFSKMDAVRPFSYFFGYEYQGCIRPRPSPFWRPSTRYNRVSDPLRGGGVRLQDFGPREGGSIAGFSDFRARSARDGAEGAVLKIFEDFLKILPN